MKTIIIAITLLLTLQILEASQADSRLVAAVMDGNLREVQNLAGNGMEINAYDHLGGYTLLSIACAKGYREVIKFLLKSGADPNLRDSEGNSPLFFAIRNDRMQVVRQLIEGGADPEISDRRQVTPLMCAIFEDRDEIAEYLICRGVNLDARNSLGATALMYAAASGNQKIVELLLDKGADRNLLDQNGCNAVAVARESGHGRIANLINEIKPENRKKKVYTVSPSII
ncbi:MAG: ankyrin repeat domain-containing protein [Candidatus Wallbacteria bacterium]|nr:ankyrin repeat domain-containing protein [Candidatus Wallbacteria bacterium]